MIRTTDSKEILYLKQKDGILSQVFDKVGNIEYELYLDKYSFLIFTIIGQMLSNKVAEKMFQSLKRKCGGSITPLSISKINDDDLSSIGISKRKLNTIRFLTNKALSNNVFLDDLSEKTDSEIIDQMCNIPGIGPWTVKMFLIFALDAKHS